MITTYFNPFHNLERLKNYHTFKENLNLPLITVEWAPDSIYEISHSDTDLLVQLSGGDLMWQKERLLNIALNKLPNNCEFVAWIDCDVVFANSDWHIKAKELLHKYDFLQLFDEVNYLPKLSSQDFDLEKVDFLSYDYTDCSLSKLIESRLNFNKDKNIIGVNPSYRRGGAAGLALASKVSTIKAHQFYDGNIVGGGDSVLFASLSNTLDLYFSMRDLSTKHKIHIKQWANQVIEKKYQTSYLKGSIYHLWHGDLPQRQYLKRHLILKNHNYDPKNHIFSDSETAWSWQDAPKELKEAISSYMYIRECTDRTI